MSITFTIPGPPVGKARPRVANGHAYTPASTRTYEEAVRARWRAARHAPFGPDVPLYALIAAYHAIPASASRRARETMARNAVLPMKKPDADNIAKIILDALNGMAYADDKQVVRLEVIKRYTPGEPYVQVTLSEEAHENPHPDPLRPPSPGGGRAGSAGPHTGGEP